MEDGVDALDGAVTKVLVAKVADDRVVADGLLECGGWDDVRYTDKETLVEEGFRYVRPLEKVSAFHVFIQQCPSLR